MLICDYNSVQIYNVFLFEILPPPCNDAYSLRNRTYHNLHE